MAIQEFIIGPQNYFEQGYFDGDYTLPNVSKSYLQCDIDNIKGGRVVTGEYYLDNYIDGTTTNRAAPTKVGTATNWQSIATGITEGHVIAIRTA